MYVIIVWPSRVIRFIISSVTVRYFTALATPSNHRTYADDSVRKRVSEDTARRFGTRSFRNLGDAAGGSDGCFSGWPGTRITAYLVPPPGKIPGDPLRVSTVTEGGIALHTRPAYVYSAKIVTMLLTVCRRYRGNGLVV